ncbi:MAG TPA: metallophosphoesterase family protein [Polyangiaceae bacterium LLY-WYZ-14_1]|nr:metallophosphoesterase family protein [Polyangiaceae bacterium LLY-WYZ-14_1]
MAPPVRSPLEHPVAILSDVHGNRVALEAVLADLADRGFQDLFVAGDLLLGGDDPLGTWQLLQQRGARCVRGLSDEALARIDPATLEPSGPEQERSAARFLETRQAIGDLVVERLRRLPEQIRVPLIDGGELLVRHGAPADPTVELSHDLDDDELLALLAGDPADVVACGASHVPFDRVVAGVRVVNVGSVGQAPEGEVAHYTILTPRFDGPEVEQRWIAFAGEHAGDGGVTPG